MRRAVSVLLILTLAACGGPAKERVREIGRVPMTVEAAPPGVRVTGSGPYCVQYERRGGTYGRPRYEVRATLQGGLVAPTPAPLVFYTVTVEAGGRSYPTRMGPGIVRSHGLPVQPAERLDTSKGAWLLEPENYAGVQQVPRGLTGCRLTLSAPSPGEIAAGGRIVPYAGDEAAVVDPDGNVRSYRLQ